MFLTRSEYDRGVNTFSPEGRLFQVEYAIEAIKLGSTAIGIQTSEGVCLAVEKRITSPLMEPSSIEKIVEIDSHIGCAMSGLIADAKTLIDKARVETQNHWFTYNETMTVESVTQAVSNLALQFGEEDADPGAMSRPFGVALLFGGVDEKGPQLFHMDPSGTFVQCDARAIGSASEGAQSSLQEVYHKSMTLKEAIKSSLVILKQVMEEKLNATNIEPFFFPLLLVILEGMKIIQLPDLLYSGWDGSQQSLGQKGRGGEASRNDCAVPNCCSHGAQCEPGVWCPCSLHRRAVTLLLRL
uniref:Proteasome subunit alpha type n=1 Tax=Gallus gallus TaxID=9031 RepID=A0A8V1A577_CHICK